MDRVTAISQLKERLRQDVGALYQRQDRAWSKPIVELLHQLRESDIRAVFFGGTLRSLLLSRVQNAKFGRPRDVDIVVAGASLEDLRDRFEHSIRRETRFGGLQLERMSWRFDVWPLDRTWAFRDMSDVVPRFAALPSTAFFNLEAVAVDVWAPPGKKRSIYSGRDQFFEGILDRVLEINREDNPFPALCVVRALVFASSTGFAIGPTLARYLARHVSISNEELAEVQQRHYGYVRLPCDLMRGWLNRVASHVADRPGMPLAFPRHKQLALWPQKEPAMVKFHVLVQPTEAEIERSQR